MYFTTQQQKALNTKVRKSHIRSRKLDGKEFSYLEGWFVIEQANKIFGYDGWTRKTLSTQCVSERQRHEKFAASYLCRVQISVFVKYEKTVREIIREGCGSGEGYGQTPGHAHEMAVKIAETDGMKRAFITFGNAFGLFLYQSKQENELKNCLVVNRGVATHNSLNNGVSNESFSNGKFA